MPLRKPLNLPAKPTNKSDGRLLRDVDFFRVYEHRKRLLLVTLHLTPHHHAVFIDSVTASAAGGVERVKQHTLAIRRN